MYHYYFFFFTWISLFANIFVFYFHVCFAALRSKAEFSEKSFENLWTLNKAKRIYDNFHDNQQWQVYFYLAFWAVLLRSQQQFYTSGK